MTHWLARVLIIVVGFSLTALSIAISFDPFFVVGASGFATIWGPAVGKPAVAIGCILSIGTAAWTAGRVRVAMQVLWLAFLAGTTHRLAERSGGRVDDVWLGLAVQRLDADRDHAPVASRCRVGTWVARCIGDAGRTLTSITPLPFVQLSPGLWERIRNQAISRHPVPHIPSTRTIGIVASLVTSKCNSVLLHYRF